MHNNTFIQLQQFRNGNEAAFTWMYGQVFTKLLRHGSYILADRCAVNTIIHEALLKTWQHRQRMQSLQHIYRFARLNVTWKCYAWYRDPVNRFHYRRTCYTADITRIEEEQIVFYDQLQPPAHYFDEERLHNILAVLPYLPPRRHNIMQLYFKHGISYKQIAKRFGTSVQGVSAEVQQSLDFLRQLIRVKKKSLKVDRCALTERSLTACTTEQRTSNNVTMPPEMETIFRYRYENKMSFATIAFKMNLSVPYVQQQYIEAHKRLRELQQNKSP